VFAYNFGNTIRRILLPISTLWVLGIKRVKNIISIMINSTKKNIFAVIEKTNL
jgi:hypothetical protein